VATERGRDGVCTPLTVRRDVRSAAPLPSQVWPWTSRRPSPSASRAQACPPGPTGACAGWRPRSRRHSSVDSRALPGGTWSPVGAAAAGAEEPARMQVALQPDEADAIIQEVAYRKVNHTPTIPHSARWLHMSRRVLSWAAPCYGPLSMLARGLDVGSRERWER
jgi:hypothetical protein